MISFISITFVRRTVTFPLTVLCCYGYSSISSFLCHTSLNFNLFFRGAS